MKDTHIKEDIQDLNQLYGNDYFDVTSEKQYPPYENIAFSVAVTAIDLKTGFSYALPPVSFTLNQFTSELPIPPEEFSLHMIRSIPIETLRDILSDIQIVYKPCHDYRSVTGYKSNGSTTTPTPTIPDMV